MKPIVVVDRIAPNEELILKQFRESIDLISLSEAFSKAKSIFIKPNLTYPQYRQGVTTRKAFVAQLVTVLRQINSTTRIYIGEGEGGYNSFSMTDAMRVMGFFDLERQFKNVEIVNLSAVRRLTTTVLADNKPYLLELPKLLLEDVDFSISCPVPKVHCMTKLTLSLKNQWGCLPDTMRLKNHYVFDDIINQVCLKLRFEYAFLDGKFGLDVNGPMNGESVALNWFVASNSLGAMDMVVSDMMGFKWRDIGHLKKAAHHGYMPRLNDITIVGDHCAIGRKFTLKRGFWNYPALAAFHSRNLTNVFYFSKWAKVLHDVMYSVRKRPID